MPEYAELHNLLLGAHPDGPEWDAADGLVEWRRGWEAGQPLDLRQCALWYGGTGTGRDTSASAETSGFVPTRPVVVMLGLSDGRDFRWQDADGLAVQDPSAAAGGPGSLLLRRDLAARLRVEGGMTVFWTVLVGRELHQPDHRPADDYRWVSASASYVLDDDTVRKVHSVATRCRPGPETEHAIAWPVRAADRGAG